jgi:hypothetical protein
VRALELVTNFDNITRHGASMATRGPAVLTFNRNARFGDVIVYKL